MVVSPTALSRRSGPLPICLTATKPVFKAIRSPAEVLSRVSSPAGVAASRRCNPSAASTPRLAWSSCATGTPNNATSPSLRKLLMVPSKRRTSASACSNKESRKASIPSVPSFLASAAPSASWQYSTVACWCSPSGAAPRPGRTVLSAARLLSGASAGSLSPAVRDAPHAWQKRSADRAGAPHAGQGTASAWPHSTQNPASSVFSRPQDSQRRSAATTKPAGSGGAGRCPAASRATRSAGSSSSAWARLRSVWKCGYRRAPRSRSAIPRTLSPARSANASCVSPAANRCWRSNSAKVPRPSAFDTFSTDSRAGNHGPTVRPRFLLFNNSAAGLSLSRGGVGR